MSVACFVLMVALTVVTITWVLSGCMLAIARSHGYEKPPWPHRVWCDLRPFFLPANVALAVLGCLTNPDAAPSAAFLVGAGFVAWVFFKDVDDDDRWKRRKAKLAEKVQRQGARLVVVPVAGGAR